MGQWQTGRIALFTSFALIENAWAAYVCFASGSTAAQDNDARMTRSGLLAQSHNLPRQDGLNIQMRMSGERRAASTREVRSRFCHHSFDDDSCRFDGVDKAGRFAKPNGRIVRVAFREGLPVSGSLYADIGLKLVFTTMPPIGESIATNPCGETPRPGNLPGDVRHPCAQRIVAVRFED